MKHILGASLIGTLLVAACVSKQAHEQEREIASVANSKGKNPLTGETFWQEFQKAKPGGDSKYLTNDEFQMGVFFRWMKANPSAAFEELGAQASAIQIGSIKRSRGPQPVHVLVNPEDVKRVLQDQHNFTNEVYPTQTHSYVPGIGAAIASPLGDLWFTLITESNFSLEQKVQSISEKTLEDAIFVGKDQTGRLFGRLEVVNQYARKAVAAVNREYFGLPISVGESVAWGRSLEDDLIFNIERNPKTVGEAAEAAKQVEKRINDLLDGKVQAAGDSLWARFDQQAQQRGLSLKRATAQERLEIVRVTQALIGGSEVTQAVVNTTLDSWLRTGRMKEAQAYVASGDDANLREMIAGTVRANPVRPYTFRRSKFAVSLPSGAKVPAHALVVLRTQFATQFRPAGEAQIRDRITEIESFEILKTLLKKSNLRRAEGHFGQLDSRRVFESHLIKKELFRYSFPERMALEFTPSSLRPGVLEIADKDFPFDDYLNNYNREEYRACLAARPLTSEGTLAKESTPHRWLVGMVRNYNVSQLNVSGENKHLLFCRMPKTYRACVTLTQVESVDPKSLKYHRSEYDRCRSNLSGTEQAFYENVFFGAELDQSRLSFDQVKRPENPQYDFEDHTRFYDRYRFRESMMNPAGFKMEIPKAIFYIRLNIDFRMCMGAPVIKHDLTGGLVGTSRDDQYEKCKDGVFNPQTFRYEGALTKVEKAYYERLMLGRH